MTPLVLETSLDRLTFCPASGRLISLTPLDAPGVELIATAEDHPAFVLQYLTEAGEFAQLDSLSARELRTYWDEVPEGRTLALAFEGVGGMDLDVRLTVHASEADPCSRWRAHLRNGAGLRVVDVQFPFVVVPDDPAGSLVQPAGFGSVIEGNAGSHVPPDAPVRWQFVPENGNSPHYPGRWFAQFIGWYANGRGLHLACEDTEANVKLLGCVKRDPGIRLGIAHVGDWPEAGERTLEYDVTLRSFTGDWYASADIYREWALAQEWATPLTARTDVPAWLLDSPPHITIRLQGYLDDGPAPAIEEFLPYEKCIPLLERLSEQVNAPLVAVLMSWERGGPWVYPDCFPPVGGDESLTNLCTMARERGWHIGSFCNGTRWVMKHLFNDYDGTEFFERNHGWQGVCRKHNGDLWAEYWDQTWRPSYMSCMAQVQTKEIAGDFVRRLIKWGMESIQFFDQNCNAATFPCFATDHGHPRIPGKWMARAMEDMIVDFRLAAQEAGQTEVIQSTEQPCNETCLQLFQQSDVRVSPPTTGLSDFAPLYHYLYHECTIMHGMMGWGAEPHHLPIRNAWNLALGEIPGAVMIGDGRLLNWDTPNWAPWEPFVGSNEDSVELLRTATAMRRGPGRDFLVFGRMQRPAQVSGIETLEWEFKDRKHAVPAIVHATWQAPGGTLGIILANWTGQDIQVGIDDRRFAGNLTVHASGRTLEAAEVAASEAITVPALGCALVVG